MVEELVFSLEKVHIQLSSGLRKLRIMVGLCIMLRIILDLDYVLVVMVAAVMMERYNLMNRFLILMIILTGHQQ